MGSVILIGVLADQQLSRRQKRNIQAKSRSAVA
jgi:hypothetical protein